MIKDKIIAITGASSGIGEATALLLAARGAKVILGARRIDRLAAVAEKTNGRYMQLDVRKKEQLADFVQLALDNYGRLDVLINNAGIGPISPLDELRVSDWEDMIDVNFKGVLYGIAAALPVFRQQNSGHFINTLSTAGLQIVPTMAVYAATKNAVRTVADALRQEAGPTIRVTSVSPGFIKTNFSDSMTNLDIKEQMKGRMEQIAISPDAIANAIAFAIDQPADVDVNDIVIRPTAQ
ncbi:SDR family oxidoreductase [Chitinophaga sancti]|uniref:NADP-dependent 3-hydroxy acid dehydrogenase YdfG n=1 Tax=Chitinophaga sancti TaxID=1004 RepID=A0A1K1S4X6_9BACT|nr:SDR family oxidoreductase [Chitinophaga sancti]WQD63710.1 SDR family oxidoreductase [Chitinophaga sancti]WQG90665.1 SDR family oxidoreductase [Chitinophaga sancti]SFW79250.1 NADP-dependent 3-hydroxy acid dehydrogenase YdfG [Chitinophaga sancti]